MFFTVLFTQFAIAQQSKNDDAKALLAKYAKPIGLSDNDLNNLRISDMYTDKMSGATIIYLQQTYKGIDIMNAVQTVAIKNDKVISVAGKRITGMEQKVNVKDALPVLTANDAVLSMGRHLGLALPAIVKALKESADKKLFTYSKLDVSSVPVKAKLIWLNDVKTRKVWLSWQVEVQPNGKADYWLVHVDALKGNVLGKMNLNISCNWSKSGDATAAAVENEAPKKMDAVVEKETGIMGVNNVTYRVIPFPAQSPIYPGGDPALVSNPWELAGVNNDATTLKWHDDGTNAYDSTQGNNVLAQEDRTANNGSGTLAKSSTTEPTLTFDFTPDFTAQPTITVNQSFALTNLFYWNNIMHDISYQYGFNEVSGNFQKKNFNRGGAQKDYVLADAQDGSGTDNANFSTPKDGQSPRMQMFLFSAPPAFTVNAPASLAGNKTATESGFSKNNKLSAKGPITNNVVKYVDNAADTSSRACNAAFSASALAGKIALIDRGGSCGFTVKVKNAQTAGAIAVIVVDNVPGEFPIIMGGTDNTITIPAVMVSFEVGDSIKQQLAANITVNVTMATGIRLDGDLDNGVISHEYTHGISNRLTGGPTNVSCLTNREQMGEGWSDYMALMVTTNWATALVTDGSKARPMGTYVMGQTTTGSGIRVHPYSTDMLINPWTYADLATQTAGEVHTIGEIWCNTIWEMTWNIIGQDGINTNIYNAAGAGGNSVALNLVMQGMKLQPCSPGFIDGRNAILKADTILYGGAYSKLIWKAFAKRGMGINASQGSSNNYKDGVADFTEPPSAAPFAGSFEALKQNNTALLEWQNIKNFKAGKVTIERSTDGTNFTKVGTTDASNRYVDITPATGKNYYRLSQAIAGTTVYSDVRTLSFNSVIVTPNPAKEKVVLTVAGNSKQLTVDLVSATGRKITSYKMNTESMQLTLPRIASGVYYLKISGDQISETQKLVIE